MEQFLNMSFQCTSSDSGTLSRLQHWEINMPISSLLRWIIRSCILVSFTTFGAMAQTVEPVDNPGRLLASNCFQCHGTNGTPVAGGFDKIAGGSVNEIVSELSEMRAEAIAGSEHPIMTVHAQAYSLAEINLISRYLATVGAVAPTSFKLTVTKAGTGKGTITSSPSGINCGSTCSKTYGSKTSVTLKAAATTGSVFAGWSGACTGTATSCTVSVAGATTVGATFNLASSGGGTGGTGSTPVSSITLKLEKAGKSYGTVVSNPVGINCGLSCEKASAPLPKNTVVTLTATPVSGRKFVGWSGACRGTALVCTVTLSAQREVKATFK
jgi:cytochrome c553